MNSTRLDPCISKCNSKWIVVILFGLCGASLSFLLVLRHGYSREIKGYQEVTGENTTASDMLEAHINKFSNSTLRHSVALAFGVTTRSKNNIKLDKINMFTEMPLFITLLPSFCKTTSPYYDYHIFMAYDNDDPNLIRKQFLKDVYDAATKLLAEKCNSASRYTPHFVMIGPSTKEHSVTWSQNAAAMEAYMAGVEYIYRITDDINMKTPGWTEKFIDTLKKMTPPNVGVCGPKHNGNQAALTFEFVHRTHIDIMGVYYFRELRNWDGDVWITEVYKPSNSKQINHMIVENTQVKGVHYDQNLARIPKERLAINIQSGKQLLQRYLKNLPGPLCAIALSLNSTGLPHVQSVIQTARLRRLRLPNWSMNVYVSHDVMRNATNDISSDSYANHPSRIVHTLRSLGSRVTSLTHDAKTSLQAWKCLAINELIVDYLLLIPSSLTLQDEQADLVSSWIRNQPNSSDRQTIMCIGDSTNAKLPLFQNICVIKLKEFRSLFSNRKTSLIFDCTNKPTKSIKQDLQKTVLKQHTRILTVH